MDQLQPNDAGCSGFESNPFKRERCKHCGRPWQLHEGIISEVTLFELQQRQILQPLRRSLLNFPASVAAAARAGSSHQPAEPPLESPVARCTLAAATSPRLEDSWFNDPEPQAAVPPSRPSGVLVQPSNDGDDFDVFRMFEPAEFLRVRPASSSTAYRQPSIKNLIDFEECNRSDGIDPPVVAPVAVITIADQTELRAPSPLRPPSPPILQGASGSASSSSVFPSGLFKGMYRKKSAGSGEESVPVSSFASVASGRSAQMDSMEEVLKQEVQYLQQMLADAQEEKKIQWAISRDEVAELQKAMYELQKTLSEQSPRKSISPPSADTVALLEAKFKMELSYVRQSGEDKLTAVVNQHLQDFAEKETALNATITMQTQQYAEMERTLLHRCMMEQREINKVKLLHQETMKTLEQKLTDTNERLVRWEAPVEHLVDVSSLTEIIEWEKDLRDEVQESLRRLEDRRVELRIGVALNLDEAPCKICFERAASCALLPCKHHAFCTPCGDRIRKQRQPKCPLCRSIVTGQFNTFAG